MRPKLGLSFSKRFLDHAAPGGHPENSQRISGMSAWFENGGKYSGLPQITPRPLDEKTLEIVHSRALISEVLNTRGSSGWFDSDTFFSSESSEVALLAAEACVRMSQEVFLGKFDRGFALVRPPGHHARPSSAMGFCLFNNIGLAAASIRLAWPHSKVAIVDFDLHHGNGTQELFYSDPNVLFVSSHRFPYYPGTGALHESGEGKGKGFTINLPLERAYGGEFVVGLYERIVKPIILQFGPDIILCSAGFDGHVMDPMSGLRLEEQHFIALTRLLEECAEKTANGRLVYCLEGGYNPAALQSSVSACIEALLGEKDAEVSMSFNENPELADRMTRHHGQFWDLA